MTFKVTSKNDSYPQESHDIKYQVAASKHATEQGF